MIENQTQERSSIDVDYIRDLRLSKKHELANQLVKLHQDSLASQKKEDKSRINQRERKLKISFGICASGNCQNYICDDSICLCEYHFALHRQANK